MRTTLVAATALAVAAVPLAFAGPAAAGSGNASVVVFHGVPDLTVDVYANDEPLLEDFEPGTITDPVSLPAGDYDLAVFAAGADPAADDPAIEAEGVTVPAGANITVAAHLNADGAPTLTPFVNDVDQIAAGQGRLTVRHTAAAPAVDILANGEPAFTGLTNPNEESADLPTGTIEAAVALAGTTDPVIGPAEVTLTEGTSTIVYAWGSATDGNLDLAVQNIANLHSAPSGVPSGEAGLADESLPLGVAGVAAVALLVAGGAALRARRAAA